MKDYDDTAADISAERRERYHLYLASPEWQEKRRAVFEREGGICEGCRTEPIEHTHHLTYKHLFDEPLFDLAGLCEGCHRKVHFISPNWKEWTP
jgi:5-methylcytosine-specific restriction endonuclease McrA